MKAKPFGAGAMRCVFFWRRGAPIRSLYSTSILQRSKMIKIPSIMCNMRRRAADELAPHMLTFYLRALASCFHSFYNAERILVDEALRRTARIALIAATRQVLANGLAVVGVRAPVKM